MRARRKSPSGRAPAARSGCRPAADRVVGFQDRAAPAPADARSPWSPAAIDDRQRRAGRRRVRIHTGLAATAVGNARARQQRRPISSKRMARSAFRSYKTSAAANCARPDRDERHGRCTRKSGQLVATGQHADFDGSTRSRRPRRDTAVAVADTISPPVPPRSGVEKAGAGLLLGACIARLPADCRLLSH